ncbi:MAG: hypothetical protein FGM15_08995 [Chthoniobacterales bacterium]|nr:hypothetical protein [Chthoniobacterales bacterium]
MPTIINDRYALMANPRAGRFADIHRASDLQGDGRVVAVKFFRNGMPDDALIRESFDRESRRLVELMHENIVKMLDYGIDKESGRPFLVLEWAGDPIGDWWKKNRPGRVKWDDFYAEIGRPLLEALAFAHSRETVHRELKPSDILRDDNGRIRLADFGIAKFPEFFDTELDIDAFLKDKQPFAPIDGYDANFSYATDVFAFGAIAIAFMDGLKVETWDQLYSALKLCTAPANVRDVIEECLAKHANERPGSALVLQSKLRNALADAQKQQPKKTCHFILTKKAEADLRAIFGERLSAAQVCERLERDFTEITCIEKMKEDARRDGAPRGRTPHRYRFYGETLTLMVVADDETRAKLLVLACYRDSSFDQLEQSRNKAWSAPFQLQAGEWANRSAGKSFIEALEEALDDHERRIASDRLGKKAEEFFWTWKKVLDLRLDHSRKGRTYHYSGYELDGDRITFQLEENPDGNEIEEIWKVVGSKVSGLVESVGERSLTLLPLGEDYTAPKNKKGRLTIDAGATERQIRKQQQALEAIRDPKAENASRLRALILNPAGCTAAAVPTQAPKWFNPQIDENKRETISKALAANDLFVVEGPPGTGKTTFIAELILQHLKKWPEKRILVTSQTHLAVDNAIERVAQLRPDLKIVRIGYAEKKVSETAQGYLLQKRVEEWSKRVREQAASFLKETAKSEGVDIAKIQLWLGLSLLLADRKSLKQVQEAEDALTEHAGVLRYELDDADENGVPRCQGEAADEKRAELQQVEMDLEERRKMRQERSKIMRSNKEKFIKMHPDWAELAELPDAELAVWQKDLSGEDERTAKFRRLFELSSEWIQRFFLKEDCQGAILADSDVVAGTCIGVESSLADEDEFGLCILDEASKATVTEALVPLKRCSKWILVGDRLQLSPFIDAQFRNRRFLEENEVSMDVFEQTLLERLLEHNIPEDCQSILTRQHRMMPAIGDLVSKVFYEGKLESVRTESSVDLSIAIPKPVTWFSTSGEDGRREQQSGTSVLNVLEARWIAKLLERIDFVCGNSKGVRSKPHVAVLSGYAAQRDHILGKLNSLRLNNLHLECHTVDNYQGREADIVIFSVTRSNNSGKPGFLTDKRRINVALSRARDYLLIVGDSAFCANLTAAPSFGKVLTHIAANPETCAIKEGIQ